MRPCLGRAGAVLQTHVGSWSAGRKNGTMDGTLGCKDLLARLGRGEAWGQADSRCLGSELTCPSAGGFGLSGPFLACDGPPVLSDSVPAWSIAVCCIFLQ